MCADVPIFERGEENGTPPPYPPRQGGVFAALRPSALSGQLSARDSTRITRMTQRKTDGEIIRGRATNGFVLMLYTKGGRFAKQIVGEGIDEAERMF